MQRLVGICLGATSITIARRTGEGLQLRSLAHEGQVGGKLSDLLDELGSVQLGLTGRKFRKRLAIPTVSEPEAVELAFAHLRSRYPGTDCIVSAGGKRSSPISSTPTAASARCIPETNARRGRGSSSFSRSAAWG